MQPGSSQMHRSGLKGQTCFLCVVWMYCYLLVRVNIDVALDTFLSHVGPGVPAHPLPLAFRALVFAEAPLLALVRRQAFAFGSSLRKTAGKEGNGI